MNINIKDIITLEDDKDYIVASKVNHNNRVFYYLINLNDNNVVKFCYQEAYSLKEFNDTSLLTELTPLFVDAAKEALAN